MSKSAPKTKAQHYVPQFYLERFSTNGRVSVFDKKEDASFESATHGIAQEKYFYDIDAEQLKTDDQKEFGNLQLAEKALSQIEGLGATSIKMLLNESSFRNLRRAIRKQLAYFIAIQNLRTKSSREEVTQIFNAFLAGVEIDPPAKTVTEIDINAASVELAKPSQTVLHLQMLFNPELWNAMAKALVNHIWIMGRAPAGKVFWTSDHPVAIRAHISGEAKSHAGVSSPGVEISYPISPNCILILKEKTYHKSEQKFDGTSVTLTAQQVDYYNELQVRSSSRWLYSSENSFSLASQLCTSEPTLKDENRQRLTLHHGPLMDSEGKYMGDVLHLRKEM